MAFPLVHNLHVIRTTRLNHIGFGVVVAMREAPVTLLVLSLLNLVGALSMAFAIRSSRVES